MMPLYSFALSLVLLLSAPWWAFRMLTTGRYRTGLAGRFGRLTPRLRTLPRGRGVIWVHAVSVGEVLAATELVRLLRLRLPDYQVVVSTTTATGQQLAQAKFPDCPVFFLPFDFRFAVTRYLDALRPSLVVLLESELWPRLLHECAHRGVPVAVANARMSDRSFRRSMRVRRLWRPVLQQVSAFLAQGEETADRLRRLGAPPDRVVVTGNLKFDLRATAETPMVDQLRRHLPPGARVLVCGSTLDTEELLLLGAWPALAAQVSPAVLVLAPRHPERFAAVEQLVRDKGLPVLRASRLAETPQPSIPPGSVVLLDTIGDLAAVYSLASAVFVGGSLVPAGGHNPLEPARFGVPVTMGRSTENFREIIEAMQTQDAIRILDTAHLPTVLLRALMGDPAMVAMGERGRFVFEQNAGATQRSVDGIVRLLHQAPAQARIL